MLTCHKQRCQCDRGSEEDRIILSIVGDCKTKVADGARDIRNRLFRRKIDDGRDSVPQHRRHIAKV